MLIGSEAMMDLIKENCTACGACSNICPNESITMIPDSEGFLYPYVCKEACMCCGLCESVCPIINRPDCENTSDPKVYAAWSIDEEVRFNSTSGGLFTELAKAVISKGGCVTGARYNKEHLVGHYIIDSEREIPLLRQSKYVQSETGNVFKHIKERLDKGKQVMFVGTPCQGAGLQSFLGKQYDNLLLCDFICRGSNSPKVYMKYLESLKKQYRSDIKKVWFKNKINGWNKFCTKIEFENGKEYYADRYTDLFMRGYLKHNLYIRPSCSNCYFKGFPRHSDITLGDFWGVKLNDDESIDTDKGTSLVIVNSSIGQQCFNSLGDRIFKKESSLEAALPFNQCAVKSVDMGEKRDYFFSEIDKEDFTELINKIDRNEDRI